MIYGTLLQQQSIIEKIERGEILGKNIINMAVANQASPQSTPPAVQAEFSELKSTAKLSTQVITNPTKLLPRAARFDRWGFSAQLVRLPKETGSSYRAAVHISLFGRRYGVRMQMSNTGFSLDRMLHVHNIIPTDSAMTIACKTGAFDGAP